MKEVHFIAQGKGGVGKSFVAALLAQYLKDRIDSEQVHCFDTDPVNPTFSRYPALNAQVVNILTATNNIDSRQFDGLIEQLIEKDGVAVVDNGAATFIPLMSYMAENGVVGLLNDVGTRIIIHVPIHGGQALKDCVGGLVQTLAALNAEVVVWLNNQLGEVGDFKSFKVYKDGMKKITNIIELPLRNPDTFAKDIQMMTSRNLTFNEVMESSEFSIMPKQRLKTVKRDVFEQLDQKPLFSVEVGHE